MVKFNQKWTSLYKNYFKDGGMNMYIKTNLKQNKTATSYCLDNNNDELYFETYFNIRAIDEFIDDRLDGFSIMVENKYFDSKWLEDWKTNRKKEVFINIYQVISSGNLKDEKLIKLNKRVERYFRYFNLIDKEHNGNDKYEEIFNTLIQIPSEIYSFIKEGKTKQKGNFITNEYHYNDNKIPSSVYIEDGIFNIAV